MGSSLSRVEELFLNLFVVSGTCADEAERFLCVSAVLGPVGAAPTHTIKQSENGGFTLPPDYLSGSWPLLWRDAALLVVRQHRREADGSSGTYL